MSGFTVSRSLIPASSTNSDSSGEYMSGRGMPTSSSTFLDAVLTSVTLVRLFRREIDAASRNVHALAKLLAELVLGRNRRHPRAATGKLCEDSRRTHELGTGHDDCISRLRFKIEVPGYAVDGRRSAGDD